MVELYIERISETAKLPEKSTTLAACYDVFADIKDRGTSYYRNDNSKFVEEVLTGILLFPQERVLIPTGWKMACPPGYCIEVLPRSGLALKKGISLANCTGIIDADYRGEVGLIIANYSGAEIAINHGDKIAQLRLTPVLNIQIIESDLPSIQSNRKGGFGSTGQ